MSTINYSKLEDIVHRKFERYGTEMTFFHRLDGEVNSTTGNIDWTYLKTKVVGIQQNYGDIFMDGENIQKGDRQLLISVRHGKPKLSDEVLIDDTMFKIINVKELSPAGSDLVYELHVRSYAPGEDIDRLFIKLADLELGSLISDPNRTGTPTWRVVGNNHHKVGVSTLLCDEVWELKSFSGVVEVGVPTARDPWSQTWMRRYLKNEFVRVLSAKMVQNMKIVIITTYGERISDNITLLSDTEIANTKVIGIDNGVFLPYFEADSFRIAYYDDPKRSVDLATEYWTRNAQGIGADGKIKEFNPNYVHGLRPVIFLDNQLMTALNYNGEYEIQFP